MELFKRFCDPPFENLPLIFNKELEEIYNPYRRFRHIVHHGYGFQLKWIMMKEGIEQLDYAFEKFSERINEFISDGNI